MGDLIKFIVNEDAEYYFLLKDNNYFYVVELLVFYCRVCPDFSYIREYTACYNPLCSTGKLGEWYHACKFPYYKPPAYSTRKTSFMQKKNNFHTLLLDVFLSRQYVRLRDCYIRNVASGVALLGWKIVLHQIIKLFQILMRFQNS